MTALCGGGNSGPKIGAAAIVDYSSGLLAVLMAELGASWLIPVIPLAGLAPLVLSSFCAGDPPAMPVFTQAESDALLKLTLGADFNTGLPKLVSLLQNVIWNDACQCTTGVYTPAAAPTQPANSITPVSTPVSPLQQTLCKIVGIQAQSVVAAGGNNFGNFLYSAAPGLQFFRIHYNRTSVGAGPHDTSTLNVFWNKVVPTFLQTLAQVPPDGVIRTIDVPILPGYDGVAQIGLTAPANSTDTYNAWAELFCGPAGVAGQGCCPADPNILLQLQQLTALVKNVQRNYQPFGYVLGPVHAGLTLTGNVPVSRLIGFKVAVTAFPVTDVQLPGNPAYVKDLGWLSISETDGMIQEKRLAQTAFTWFPPDAVLATQINYFLNPGVTVTITEMQAEP